MCRFRSEQALPQATVHQLDIHHQPDPHGPLQHIYHGCARRSTLGQLGCRIFRVLRDRHDRAVQALGRLDHYWKLLDHLRD